MLVDVYVAHVWRPACGSSNIVHQPKAMVTSKLASTHTVDFHILSDGVQKKALSSLFTMRTRELKCALDLVGIDSGRSADLDAHGSTRNVDLWLLLNNYTTYLIVNNESDMLRN